MQKFVIITTLVLLIACESIIAQTRQVYKQSEPLAHTYSIVARDEKTGEMAVAVQSHWFSVGSLVAWGEAGVGVVATQSFINKSFGVRGLALLKEGKTPQEALDILLSTDEARDVRQVAILDKLGRVAVYTGKSCIKFAGHQKGDNFSVQANLMMSDKVWPAMAKAFEENNELPLAERVMTAMRAAQNEGGDIRGKQSAILLVVKGESTGKVWDDRLIDLRVDDNPSPIDELERLLKVYQAYAHMNNGDHAVETGNMKLASEEYQKAEAMFPDNLEMQFWHAITLLNNGQFGEGSTMLKTIFQKDDNWRILTGRLPASGLLTISEKELEILLNME